MMPLHGSLSDCAASVTQLRAEARAHRRHGPDWTWRIRAAWKLRRIVRGYPL